MNNQPYENAANISKIHPFTAIDAPVKNRSIESHILFSLRSAMQFVTALAGDVGPADQADGDAGIGCVQLRVRRSIEAVGGESPSSGSPEVKLGLG